jgi:RHS repeat-associated protein
MEGELLAEYAANTAAGSPQKEYGYRNGQLLITATLAASGWDAPPSFTPPAMLVSGGDIKLEHLTDLRTAVNQLRSHAGLTAASFTVDPNPMRYVTTVKADHILQLRTALEGARIQLGLTTGGYAHPGLHATDFIYAIDFQELRNQILSAWNSGGTSGDIEWLVTDQLGTPRMVFDQTGALATTKRHDYLPFGEELAAGTGGRSIGQGYVADNVRQKFTQKERDNETGLDYSLARYYSSTQGRFTSPDDFLNDTHVHDPASWNLYAYVRNNPLKLVDPTGEAVNGAGLSDAERQQLIDDWQRKTGYNHVYFDKNNNLVIDRNAGIARDADGNRLGSALARANLTDAIETKDVFNLEHANGSSQVAFADNELSVVTTNAQTKETVRTYRVRIDFSDLSHTSGDREGQEANSIGLVVLHEFDHNLYGHLTDSPNGPNDPGPIETNYINPIRDQLGLAQRATYNAVPVGGSVKEFYRGYVQVRYTLNGRDKMLRWQDTVVGGKHK